MQETHFARIRISRALAETQSKTALFDHIRHALIAHIPRPVAHILDVQWTAYADPELGALRCPGLSPDEILIEGEITYTGATQDWESLKTFLSEQIADLTREQRLELFDPWCAFCGRDAPCHCWNDD